VLRPLTRSGAGGAAGTVLASLARGRRCHSSESPP